jgi:hypothetical protein
MQPRIISTYADLLGEIERLEAPHPGRVRVFRGQTKDYGRMLPSGLRRPLRNEFVWHYYAMLLARELLATHNEKSQPWDAKMLTFWDKEAVWIKALAQHYGPGSIFLDVTRSLDVAVWFALHSAERVKADSNVGPLDPGSPAEDTTQEEWMDYCKWNAEGFLFVFDVPECPASSPGHGQLLDLSKARPIFSESRRIKGQAACLIAADPDINGGDLQNFVREVIRVQWPMQNAPRLDLPIEEMFPEPSQDEWYKLLVSIPLTYQLHEETGNLNLARPLEVLLYFYKARNKTKEILHQSRHLPRARLHLSDTLKMKLVSGESPKVSEFRLSEATHILLEAPIIAWVPPANSEMWNHGILAGDMTDSIDAFEGPTDEACCSLSLKNLYIEFSPLEVTGWEQLNDPNGRIDLLGGLWIVRNETHFALRLFPQVVKSPRVCTVQDSPPSTMTTAR